MVIGKGEYSASWDSLISYILPPKLFNESPRWTPINEITYTPEIRNQDGDAIDDWEAAHAYGLGDFVKPTTMADHVYECVTAGISGGAEPGAWGTDIGEDTADNTVSWRCRGLNCIATDEELTGTLVEGLPLKYKYNGSVYYGIILDVTADYIFISCALRFRKGSDNKFYSFFAWRLKEAIGWNILDNIAIRSYSG